jgi:16S rRNA (cytosine1402-N4)-methyltransferase
VPDVHVPVLLERTLALLEPSLSRPGAVLVDATLGLAGHTEAVLQRFADATVIGIDRDPEAIERSRERLAPFGDRAVLVQAVYDRIDEVLDDLGRGAVDAVLFDLGVSSMQLDRSDRGFAYAQDAPLDMRMHQGEGMTAADVLNTYGEKDLVRILRTYGEEKFAARIAASVVSARDDEPFDRSGRLVDLVRDATPQAARRTGGNPAKRTFQALRIEVNDELGVLRRAVPVSLACVGLGGRVVSLAYHSLEDRIVKRAFTEVTTSVAPPDLPVVPQELKPRFRLLTRGAEVASPEEITTNRRAQSVRLRAVERTEEAA